MNFNIKSASFRYLDASAENSVVSTCPLRRLPRAGWRFCPRSVQARQVLHIMNFSDILLHRRVRLATVLLGTTLLAGCAVGPNYHQPAAPKLHSYTTSRLPNSTASTSGAGGTAQHLVIGQKIAGEWWTLYHSKPLDALIRKALGNNPSLESAQYTLLAARDTARAAEGGFFPSISGSFQAERVRSGLGTTSLGSAGAGLTYSLRNASVAVSYAPDVFGGTRRQVESLHAQAEQQRFALEATYLSLTANIVTASVTEASLTAQIEATERIIRAEKGLLDILDRQVALGGIPETNAITQRTQLAQTEATLPPLRKQLAQTRDQLAAYEGVPPSRFHAADFTLADLALPESLPVSLPSALVRQRPDIREAAAVLHQDTAQVGVATANMLPQITLSAGIGHEALDGQALFAPQTLLWNLAAGITQPFFEGGTLFYKRRAAVATMKAAAETYENTVVLAFQNVADALEALHYDAIALAADTAAEHDAQRSLNLIERQFRLGGVPYTSVLTAEQTYESAVITRIKATAQRYADTAALFQALGGGWWHRHDVKKQVETCCGVLP